MKRIKFAMWALLAFMMVSLSSCLNGNSNGNITLNMADFMYVRQEGTRLLADDGHTFSVQNPAALKFQDGTTPNRVFVQLWVDVPSGMDIKKVYDTPDFPVTVMNAVKCYENVIIDKDKAPEKNNPVTSLMVSVNPTMLNIYFQSVQSADALDKDFNLFIDDIKEDKVLLTFRNSVDSKQAMAGLAAVSYPLKDLISRLKGKVKPNEKNQVKLVVNDMETILLEMPYE